MQISKVSEGERCGDGGAGEERAQARECRTPNELLNLMTKNTLFDSADDYSLSAQDLVLLYENIDVGTRLMTEASESTIKKSNQYVETVVYNDHETGSDCSEMLTFNDIQDTFNQNQEKVDFLNDTSFENLLCNKLGGLDLNTSNLSFDYDKSFMFKDQYIKNQMQNFNLLGGSTAFGNLFSTPLIDYICCRRLEDNYNFYMDNIIRYVQNTIEQLKRISNGDYLSGRVKEKWRQLNCNTEQEDNKKVLATSTSIPLHVECKTNGNATWDDIVHSEVDVRSLSKILEKKIIVEIPKVICGSYRLYSKQCSDNLIIRCQREHRKAEKKGHEPRVDVVLQLQRSQTGHVMSNISSIMILKTTPGLPDLHAKEVLPLTYEDKNCEQSIQKIGDYKEPSITVIELIRHSEPVASELRAGVKDTIVEEIIDEENDDNQDSQNEASCAETNDYPFSERIASYASIPYSSESSLTARDTPDRSVFHPKNDEEKTYNLISPDELHTTMRRLNLQNSILNESSEDAVSQCTSKRRSPVRIRIKSPYENKSFLMEEKKRKRLLEIRERREMKKIALSENCKISKHKYGKGAILPQASSSVTKLSITNKSFYNSIYGHNVNPDSKPRSRKPLKGAPEASTPLDETQEDFFDSSMLTPDKNDKKYINRSYYLDEPETEMMYLQMKKNEDKETHNTCSASDSNVSNEFNESLDILQELIAPSETNLIDNTTHIAVAKFQGLPEASCSGGKLLPIEEGPMPMITYAKTQNSSKKSSSGDECRKSIDQLYDLMNKFGKPNNPTDLKITKSKQVMNIDVNDLNMIQGSESGTSLKHVNVSNHSDSPGRSNIATLKPKSIKTPGVPKVIISSKLQSPKSDVDKLKKDRTSRTVISPPFKGPLPENPLKAISQLLHEFDNVQKNRQKPPIETKPSKKVDFVPTDTKIFSRQNSHRRKSRIDQHLKDNDQEKKVLPNGLPKEKRIRPTTPLELARTPHKQIAAEDRNIEKPPKKITDIIDEAKEARGEAVRGPSKTSRLYSLAQPKKSYVQAHHEEYQNRYGKNVLAERLQKLATSPAPVAVVEKTVTSPTALVNRSRWRKSGTEAATAPMKQPAPSVPQLDQQKTTMTWNRRSASSSPESAKRIAGHKRSPTLDDSDAVCKMVSVESYVHSHYGGAAPPRDVPPAGLRCRVPFVPRDMDLASMASSPSNEAAELGDTLHRMVGSVVSGRSGPAPLAALAEDVESRSPRSESDYCVNILEDRHVITAVGSVRAESLASRGPRCGASAEIEQLETALYTHISGAFQKRLRIKNLTLTPKSSMQRVFLLQSGDAGSMLFKSVSNLLNKNSTENFDELKPMPVLSNSHLDWRFAQLPLQISTVGYAYPEHHLQNAASETKLIDVSVRPSSVTTENAVQKLSQSSQCLRGLSPRPVRDSGAQADVVASCPPDLITVSVGSNDSHASTRSEHSQIISIKPAKDSNDPHHGSLVTLKEIQSGHVHESDTSQTVDDTDSGVKQKMTIDDESDSASKLAPAHPRAPSPSPDTVSYTTSLDMLVGLLTEIQKITCQNQMEAGDHRCCTDLEITKDIITVNKRGNTCDVISITSLDNLRQLESTGSIYSYYLSNDGGSSNGMEPVLEELRRNSRFTEDSDVQPAACVPVAGGLVGREHVAVGASKPAVEDKEVSANLCDRHADVCFNVSSQAISECPPPLTTRTPPPSSTDTQIPKIIELPQIETPKGHEPISRDKTDLNEKDFTLSIRNIKTAKNQSIVTRRELRCCVKNIDFDPMFKIKRDLLVSMYSILVLTVFAALSFPGLLMFES